LLALAWKAKAIPKPTSHVSWEKYSISICVCFNDFHGARSFTVAAGERQPSLDLQKEQGKGKNRKTTRVRPSVVRDSAEREWHEYSITVTIIEELG
jgi:hypothetical protein